MWLERPDPCTAWAGSRESDVEREHRSAADVERERGEGPSNRLSASWPARRRSRSGRQAPWREPGPRRVDLSGRSSLGASSLRLLSRAHACSSQGHACARCHAANTKGSLHAKLRIRNILLLRMGKRDTGLDHRRAPEGALVARQDDQTHRSLALSGDAVHGPTPSGGNVETRDGTMPSGPHG